MKRCSKCGDEHEGKHSYCPPCLSAYRREWRRKNPDAQRAAKKKWEAAHPEEVKAAKRRRYEADLEKSRAYQRKRRAENPEAFAEYARRRREKAQAEGLYALYRHGLTAKQRAELFERQGGKCPLCDRPLSGTRIHIDHDHATGKIRGLLCQSCNSRLGWYENRIGLVAAYLAASHLDPTPRTGKPGPKGTA